MTRVKHSKGELLNMDTTDSLVARIKKTGYPLEIEISSYLDSNWDVINTDTYVDRDENKIKDIDIHASAYIFVNSEIDFSPHLIVECKKSDYLDWVFFTRPHEKAYMDVNGHYLDAEQRFCQRLNTITLLNLLLSPLQLHYWTNERLAVSYKEFVKENNSKEAEKKLEIREEFKRKPIFNALNQVKKFIYDRILNGMTAEGYPYFVDFYFPCIVFDGNMYEAIVEKGEILLKPTNHVILASSIPSASNNYYMNYLVDVVQKDFFKEYLGMVISDVQRLIDTMVNQREKALSILERAYSSAIKKWEEEEKKSQSSNMEKKPKKKTVKENNKPQESSKNQNLDPDKLDWELRMP